MSAPKHQDPSQGWLILFFVCFAISVFGIGVWQLVIHYNPDAAEAPVEAGHH
jgi:hypothetical protein